MSDPEGHERFQSLSIAGTITGALTVALHECVDRLRTHTDRQTFEADLARLEAEVIRAVVDAPFDDVAEADQLIIAECARSFVADIFAEIRERHGI